MAVNVSKGLALAALRPPLGVAISKGLALAALRPPLGATVSKGLVLIALSPNPPIPPVGTSSQAQVWFAMYPL